MHHHEQADDADGDQRRVQGKEPSEGRIAHGKVASQPDDEIRADEGYGAEQVGDYRRPPIGHLSPGKEISHESLRHKAQVDGKPNPPDEFPRAFVRSVVKSPRHMQVNGKEKSRRSDGMQGADEPAVVDVPHDMLDAVEGKPRVRLVVHGKPYAGENLNHQKDAGKGAEIPPVVEVFWRRIAGDVLFDKLRQGETPVDPLPH